MTSSLSSDSAAWSAWESARSALLIQEKKLSKLKDEITEQRRQLPWLKVDQTYKLIGENGSVSLIDLFGSTQKQLLVYNMMSFDGDDKPTDKKHGLCDNCGLYVEEFNTVTPALLKYAAVAVICRAPYAKLQALAKQRGWIIPIYSCEQDFTIDLGTEQHPKADRYGNWYKIASRPALSAFHLGRSDGSDPQSVFLTYMTADRGIEEVDSYLGWFDRLPVAKPAERQPAPLVWAETASSNKRSRQEEHNSVAGNLTESRSNECCCYAEQD